MTRFWVFSQLFIIALCQIPSTAEFENDNGKTYAEYMASHGYLFETHKPVTQDGYILTLWHIPGKLKEPRTKKPPVLLMHGVLDNGFSWLFKDMYKNLPIMLLEQGYDVWVGNNRGTIQCLEHIDKKNFNWKSTWSKYWEFSFDEMAEYDLPTMIEYITEISGFDKITYIGHSQGTAQFFAKTALDPEYVNSKIKAFVALSPVLYVKNAPGTFEKIMAWLPAIDALYHTGFGNFWTFPGLSSLNEWIIKLFPRILPFAVQLIAGSTKNQTLDLDRMSFLAASEPGGTSVQNLMHWMQLVRNGGFSKFDYGKAKNLEKYGTTEAPSYEVKNLGKISFPLYLLVAKCDNIIGWSDYAELKKLLPKGFSEAEVDDYGHLDYIWADDAHVKIYPQIIEFINKNK